MSERKKSKRRETQTEKAGGEDVTLKKSVKKDAKKKEQRGNEAANGPVSLLADESAINPALSSLFAPKVSLRSFVVKTGDEADLYSIAYAT